MSVSIYNNSECKYRYDYLDNYVFLIASNTGNIHIDNGVAYIDELSVNPQKLRTESISIEETEELDERYQFSHQVNFRVGGYVNYNDLNERYYVIVRSKDGVYWMLNPLFPCKVNYTYTLNGTDEYTDFTLSTISNHPVLRVDDFNPTTARGCAYSHNHIEELWLNEKKYSLCYSSGIKYTNDGLKRIYYDKNSCSITETFDGDNLSQNIQFNIRFDDYKSSWHYNLLEFVENTYAAIIKISNGLYIIAGVYQGLQPSFQVSASNNETPNTIQITLSNLYNSGEFLWYDGAPDVEGDNSTSYVYTTDYDGYECLTTNTARYLLKKEVDILGNETGNYMCLEGYEDLFENLNIVDTFSTTEEFTSSLCREYQCYLKTSLPEETMVFNWTGIKTFSLECETDWTLSTDSNHLLINPSSGEAGVNYTVQIYNSLNPSQYDYTTTITLAYCEGTTKEYNVLVTPQSCFYAGSTFNINANAQWVKIPTNCCTSAVTDSSGTITNIDIQDSYINAYVPSNITETASARTITLDVTMCNGRTDEITINQSANTVVWVTEGTKCKNGQKCDIQRKCINVGQMQLITSETRLANCADNAECISPITRWVDAGTTTCLVNTTYSVQKEQISYDNGATWDDTGQQRVGLLIMVESGECTPSSAYIFTGATSVGNEVFNVQINGYGSYVATTKIADGQWGLEYDDELSSFYYAYWNNDNITSVVATDNIESMYVNNAQHMFAGCSALTSIDVSNMDTSTIEDMGSMFDNCRSLTSLNLSTFDTRSATDMSSMFADCSGLTSLNVYGFDTSSVATMEGMFYGCGSLTTLDLSSFDTSACTNMLSMFTNCSELTSLDLSNFDTSNVTNMSGMFAQCLNLQTLNLSSFDFTNVSIYDGFFGFCDNLTTIYCSSGNKAWIQARVQDVQLSQTINYITV